MLSFLTEMILLIHSVRWLHLMFLCLLILPRNFWINAIEAMASGLPAIVLTGMGIRTLLFMENWLRISTHLISNPKISISHPFVILRLI